MTERHLYLEQLKPFINKPQIKVFNGYQARWKIYRNETFAPTFNPGLALPKTE